MANTNRIQTNNERMEVEEVDESAVETIEITNPENNGTKLILDEIKKDLRNTMAECKSSMLADCKNAIKELESKIDNTIGAKASKQKRHKDSGSSNDSGLRNASGLRKDYEKRGESSKRQKMDKKFVVEERWKRQGYDSSRIESVRRRLLEADADDNFGTILHQIKDETLSDMIKLKVETGRMTIDPNPKLGLRTCQYYQSGRCKQTSFSLVHLDRNYLTNNRGYVHGCSLCYLISKGIVEHRLWDCELIIQLDEAAKDPDNFKPVLLVLKDE